MEKKKRQISTITQMRKEARLKLTAMIMAAEIRGYEKGLKAVSKMFK